MVLEDGFVCLKVTRHDVKTGISLLAGVFKPNKATDLNYWIKHPFEFSDPILKPEYL